MKKKFLEMAGTGAQGDGFGPLLLMGGIILAVAFFGLILFDAYRMRKRARQMQGRSR